MVSSAAEFARSAVDSYQGLDGFAATEAVRGASIEATARVRFRKPEMIHLEYRTYRSPITELDEALTNGAEFTEAEIIGMVFSYDGRSTWLYDAGAGVAIQKPSRALFEPLPAVEAMGEIAFLEQLTRDFLIRDAGTETIAGRSTRLLGLKPKHSYRSHLLKSVTFPIRRATVALDEETLFPLRIRFYPAVGSALLPLAGAKGAITIEYSDVRREAPEHAVFAFSPPEGTRVFRETVLRTEELSERLPFPFAIDGLLQQDYRLLGGAGSATIDEKNGRGYCTLTLVPEQETENRPRWVTVRVGNYLSRNMSRRNATISEAGKDVRVRSLNAKLLDRRPLWAERVPDAEPRAPLEIAWEEGGVFWFVAAEGVEESGLTGLASSLIKSTSAD
jgi:outer membrane lipoprotein-sorting protein